MGKRDVDVTLKGKDQTGPALNSAGAGVTSFGKRVTDLLNPVNLLKGGLAALSVGGFGALAKKAVESANESEAAWSRVESAVGNAGLTFGRFRGELDDVFASIQQTTRYSDDQAADAFATLMSITQDYTGSLKNLSLATNIAAAKKIDLATAAELVGKAAIGETGALKKQGIVIKEGADAIAELGKRFNGFAERDAATMQGQLLQVANAWDNVLESMGRALLGMTGAQSTTSGLSGKLNELSKWIDENRTSLNEVGQSLAYIVEQFTSLVNMPIMAAQGFGEVGGVLGHAYYAATNWMRSKESKVDLHAEDAGDSDYYKALGQIRARRERAKRLELEAQKQRLDDAKAQAQWEKDSKEGLAQQDKRFGRLQGDLAGEAKPKVGLTHGTPGADPTLRDATLADAHASAGAIAEVIDTAQIDKATQSVFSLRDAIDSVATGSLRAMADTWEEAVVSIVSGSDKAGAAIGKAIRKGVGAGMMAEGRQNLLSSAAIAIKGLFNPVDWGRAAKLFGIGTAQITTGALFMGGGGGGGGGYSGGGGVGSSGFSSQQREVAGKGDMTLVIEGGVLDMSDPRQERAFVDALESVTGRRVIVLGG